MNQARLSKHTSLDRVVFCPYHQREFLGAKCEIHMHFVTKTCEWLDSTWLQPGVLIAYSQEPPDADYASFPSRMFPKRLQKKPKTQRLETPSLAMRQYWIATAVVRLLLFHHDSPVLCHFRPKGFLGEPTST